MFCSYLSAKLKLLQRSKLHTKLFILFSFDQKMTTLWLIPMLILYNGVLRNDASVYPKFCQSESDCELGQVCTENHCVCNAVEGFEHNETVDSCVKVAGAQCFDGKTEYKCVAKAICNLQSGVCECDQGYVVNVYGECRRGYGDPCNSRSRCSVSAMLVCDKKHKLCRCKDPETMAYDVNRKICVSIVGGICELEAWMGFQQQCVSNAECLGAQESIESYGRCACKKGFQNFSDSLCLKAHMSDCFDDSECITGFCGYSNKCDCRRGTVYDNIFESCRASIGRICDDYSLQCTANALCDPWTRKCKCEDGFLPEGAICVEDRQGTTSSGAIKHLISLWSLAFMGSVAMLL